MKTTIILAREYLKGLRCNKEQVKYLCENAIRAGVQVGAATPCSPRRLSQPPA
jgi:hypothetical protein